MKFDCSDSFGLKRINSDKNRIDLGIDRMRSDLKYFTSEKYTKQHNLYRKEEVKSV
jgi:hypothetical protein